MTKAKTFGSILKAAILLGLSIGSPAALRAQPPPAAGATQTTPPDFSGVYYPINPFGRAFGGRAGAPATAAQRQGPPPRPTPSAPLADGSQGRAPDAPALTPEYMAKWETIRQTPIPAPVEYHYSANRLP